MNPESTQPRIFHIHIDALNMPKELDDYAIKQLGFYDTDFSGHPDGYSHFEPKRHLTIKLKTKQEFEQVWNDLKKNADDSPDFVGYLEGEFIPEDEFLPFIPYNEDVEVPFSVKRRRLKGTEHEQFRQTELHLTMEKTQSNPVLMKKLLDSGLYGAFLPKKDGEFLVLTMQGFIKDIEPLYQKLKNFLIRSGGAHRCTLKEERAIRFKLYGVQPVDLPEIADQIVYR